MRDWPRVGGRACDALLQAAAWSIERLTPHTGGAAAFGTAGMATEPVVQSSRTPASR